VANAARSSRKLPTHSVICGPHPYLANRLNPELGYWMWAIFRTIRGHVLVYSMYWYPVGHPIGAVPNFDLGCLVPSHQCWYIMYHPKFQVRISCTIPHYELGCHVLSQIPSWGILYHPRARTGIFWAKIWDRGPGFGPLGHCRCVNKSALDR
jgi:hypothetical protein